MGWPFVQALVMVIATELLPELAERTASGYLFGGLSASRGRSVQIADAVFDGGGLSGVAFSAEVGVVSRVPRAASRSGRGASSAGRRTTS